MSRKIITIGICGLSLLFTFNLFGQNELFIPRNILAAYEKGTRAFDGTPGTEYWQNHTDYKISVYVNPTTYLFDGSAEIAYYNNSPDSLRRLVLRLYQNIFKKGSVRDYGVPPDAVTDGVIIKEIKIDGLPINLENRSNYHVSSTVAILNLPKAVSPNGSINLSIDWSFQFSPKANLRVGVFDSTSVFNSPQYIQYFFFFIFKNLIFVIIF